MKFLLKVFVPTFMLMLGASIAWYLHAFSPKPQRQFIERSMPMVVVKTAIVRDVRIPVYSRGELKPATEISLISEVSGKIKYISPNLVNGGAFGEDELLLAVDDSRYRVDVKKAKSKLITAMQRLERLTAELEEDDLIDGLAITDNLRGRSVAEAEAQVDVAKADVALAKLQLSKTEIRAPFEGRVKEAVIGLGQYIAMGTRVAHIFRSSRAEVRLPLSYRQWALVDIPKSNLFLPDSAPRVTLKVQYGKSEYYWQGIVVRAEAGLDSRNRLHYIVAQVNQPFAQKGIEDDRPPLTSGQLLEAEIEGRLFKQVVMLPRDVLHNGYEVWVVDAEQKLRIRRVDLVYKSKQWVYVKSGLKAGEQVVTTPLDFALDGMLVRISDIDVSHIVQGDVVRSGTYSKVTTDERPKVDVKTTENKLQPIPTTLPVSLGKKGISISQGKQQNISTAHLDHLKVKSDFKLKQQDNKTEKTDLGETQQIASGAVALQR